MNSRFKKRIAVGACVVAITLIATAPRMLPQLAPPLPQIRPVCEPKQQSRVMPHPLAQAPSVEPGSLESDTQMPPSTEGAPESSMESVSMSELPPTPERSSILQPTTVAPPQTPAQPTEPKMGDTRTIDGQKQVYFLGFGWIEDNDEPNECIYTADMYENGNKIGEMGGGTLVDGDGDINKMVGIMGGESSAGCSESEQP